MVNNRGIMHIAYQRGGMPFCKNNNGHMSTTPDRIENEPLICKRCAAKLAKIEASLEKAKRNR
jgi:hypothetical protein